MFLLSKIKSWQIYFRFPSIFFLLVEMLLFTNLKNVDADNLQDYYLHLTVLSLQNYNCLWSYVVL
jgi:hypothetical protein